jgi:uncharacterized phage protein gp47/JayE
MYENETYEVILQRSLDRVATNVDKREGSIVMNAIAPVSAEHANIYILLDGIIREGYADTATREFLIQRCKEIGIYPYSATQAVLKGKFNMEIPIGSRFNLDELNYKAIAFMEDADGFFYYQMECETAGTEGNKYFGELDPIDFISTDIEGELIELLIPARDEEETEALRTRYFNAFSKNPFGGNKQGYRDKIKALEGVGGVIPIPVWNGGGTVKTIIINSDYNVASDTLVAYVQNAVDPHPQGTGSGTAPIGHTVTVVSATEKPIDIRFSLLFNEGYTWEAVRGRVIEILEEYLLELRKVWENGDLEVRVTQIETRLLDIEGVLDIKGTTINGETTNLVLSDEELPIFGGVTND